MMNQANSSSSVRSHRSHDSTSVTPEPPCSHPIDKPSVHEWPHLGQIILEINQFPVCEDHTPGNFVAPTVVLGSSAKTGYFLLVFSLCDSLFDVLVHVGDNERRLVPALYCGGIRRRTTTIKRQASAFDL